MVAVQWRGSPNFHPQSGVSKLFITLHWMVGTLASTDVVFSQTARKASATYGVGQTEIHQYVQEKDYPFSDGNTYANQHTISIEHEGGYLLADGSRKNPTPATLELSAQLCADIARRHGWGSLQWMVNVFPHKHWVATACPGTLDYATIINRANELLGANVPPLSGVNGGSSSPLGWNASSWTTGMIQAALMRLGYDLGPTGADDDYGLYTTKAVHKFEVDQGLTVDVGIAGTQVITRLAQLTGASAPVGSKPAAGGPTAPPFPLPAGSFFGPEGLGARSVSGYHGHSSDLRVWQQRMKDRGWDIIVDGLYGPKGATKPIGNTASIAGAFQRQKGLTVDKEIGLQTWNAAWTAPIT
jgi:peptidoglycan hydrolase-like protein with peptidoglycan-binding domain